MRILVWNVNALMPTVPNFVLKHGSLKGFFDEYSADVICFQETKLQSEEKLTKETACVDGYESFWAFSREKKGYSGVATYVAERYSPIDAQVDCLGTGNADIDREGRVVLTDLGAFVLINVYVPNAGDRSGDGERTAFKVRFLEALKEKADAFRAAGRQVIIVGDLNVAASQKDVHSKLKYDWMYSSEEKKLMQSLLKDYTDAWRLKHPGEQSTFTVWDEKTSARAFNEGVRIDYALLSPELLQHLVSCEVISTLPPKWSDHAAVLLELADIPALPKHPPCALSSRRIKRFQQPKTSVASLFAKKRAAQTAACAPDGSAPVSTDTKKPKTERASTLGNKAIADGASAADAATPSSGTVETSMEKALKEVGHSPQAMEDAEDGAKSCHGVVLSKEHAERTRLEGASAAGRSEIVNLVDEDDDPADIEERSNNFKAAAGNAPAEEKQSSRLVAVKSRRPSSVNMNGNQKSIRAFFEKQPKA